jgi:hypothetical protein
MDCDTFYLTNPQLENMIPRIKKQITNNNKYQHL